MMQGSNAFKAFQVLLIEDNEADVDLVKEAIADVELHIELHVSPNGEDSMAFLRKKDKYASAPRPDLILLDLNLPKKDGREVLQEVKEDPILRLIPVIVLTTSAADDDILKSYRLHANCYIIKPMDFETFKRIIQLLKDFWFSVVTLPRQE